MLKFAKVNMYLNPSVPGAFIQQYPTIKLYPIVSKDSSVVYSGDRTVEALLEWVEDYASFDFDDDAGDDKQAASTKQKPSAPVDGGDLE